MRTLEEVDADLALGGDLACECMVCDLPEDAEHGPVERKVVLFFPGPYPNPGEAAMLLCEHCKEDWVHGEWDSPYDNFIVTQVVPA